MPSPPSPPSAPAGSSAPPLALTPDPLSPRPPGAATALILGGARSGKSARALELADGFAAGDGPAGASGRVFVATAEPFDDELAERVARHRVERGDAWRTVEAPLELPEAIRAARARASVVVVDCLTVWLGNLMHRERDVGAATAALLESLDARPGESPEGPAAAPLVLVSNEVGLGLVPETPLGRRFRDEQGRLNREVAARSTRVEFVAAGLPLRLK